MSVPTAIIRNQYLIFKADKLMAGIASALRFSIARVAGLTRPKRIRG